MALAVSIPIGKLSLIGLGVATAQRERSILFQFPLGS